MENKIVQCSPVAMAMCKPEKLNVKANRDESEYNVKYPVQSLLVGEAFTIGFDDMKPGTLASLRSLASKYRKKLARDFKVIVHKEYACVEFARVD